AALVRWARLGRAIDPDRLISKMVLRTQAELCTDLFGEASGAVEAGNQADLVIYDFTPCEQAASEGAPHLLLQWGRSDVAWTIVAGQVVVREGRLLAHDYVELAKEAERAVHCVRRRAGVHVSGPSRPSPE